MSSSSENRGKTPDSAVAGAGSQGSTTVRRVVTAKSADGKSVFVSDGEPPRQVTFETVPIQEYVELWSTDATPSLPFNGVDPTIAMASFVPGVGGRALG